MVECNGVTYKTPDPEWLPCSGIVIDSAGCKLRKGSPILFKLKTFTMQRNKKRITFNKLWKLWKNKYYINKEKQNEETRNLWK
jgi:hypothetical protein